jgi:hypothetical protein
MPEARCEEPVERYEPPAITRLGSIRELTSVEGSSLDDPV